MIIENISKNEIEIESKICKPGERIEVSDELDLSTISVSFRVIGKKLREPLKANIKEVNYGSKQ